MFAQMTGSGRPVNSAFIPKNDTSLTRAFVASSLVLLGTGSAFMARNVPSWKTYVQPKVHFALELENFDDVFIHAHHIVDIRSVSEHLINIREILAPSMSELAKDLGVTRQALYKWLSGESQPEDEFNQNFILTLSKIADAFSEADVRNAKMMIKMRNFNGLSLMELLRQGKDWKLPLQKVIEESKAMSAAADKANFLGSKAKASNAWQSSVSIPGSGSED